MAYDLFISYSRKDSETNWEKYKMNNAVTEY